MKMLRAKRCGEGFAAARAAVMTALAVLIAFRFDLHCCPDESDELQQGVQAALAALRGSLDEQNFTSISARRSVAGVALGAATSATSVLVIGGKPSDLF